MEKMMKSHTQRKATRREDSVLKGFLNKHEDGRLELKKLLRTRSFVGEQNAVTEKVINFLNDAGLYLAAFDAALDLSVKTDFLKSLMRAWEIADATGTFNRTLKAYVPIKEFSAACIKKIAALPRDAKIPAAEKVYWQEVARVGLIVVADDYRAQKLDRCRDELDKLLSFVKKRLQDRKMRCDGILGQIYYFLSKVNRMDGQLDVSEDNLITTANHYSESARQLANRVNEIESALRRGKDAGLEEALRDAREKLAEVTLRTGVTEVSRAWLYFSQGNYQGAKHSAHIALLLLCTSSDELTQYHARLVSAAVDRVTSDSATELDETVSKLTEIRDYFRRKGHSRLQARAEYELVLALILLDSTLKTADRQRVKNKAPLKDAEKCLQHHFAYVPGRWESSKLTLRSRYRRHAEMKKPPNKRNFSAAIKPAEDALAVARRTNNRYCQIEALIAGGEAHYEQGMLMILNQGTEQNPLARSQGTMPPGANERPGQNDSFAAAKKNLEEALNLCFDTNFPELTAIVRLWLARIAVRVNRYDEAEYHLHEFRRIKIQEHAWIKRLQTKVFFERQRKDSFELREDKLTKKEAFKDFRNFLIQKAREKAIRETGKVTDEQVRKILGISRVTLSKWRGTPSRHRTASSRSD
jgi:tetratricopeptide (TPR) repeat protein